MVGKPQVTGVTQSAGGDSSAAASPPPTSDPARRESQDSFGSVSEDLREARKRRIAAGVPSDEASSTKIILIDSRSGDSLSTRRRPRLVSMRYCSLYTRTITEGVVVVLRFALPSEYAASAVDAVAVEEARTLLDEAAGSMVGSVMLKNVACASESVPSVLFDDRIRAKRDHCGSQTRRCCPRVSNI
jgi:hypothetical protein